MNGNPTLIEKHTDPDPLLTIHNALVCLEPDCEVVYHGDYCPRCGNRYGFEIAKVLPPLTPRLPESKKGIKKKGRR